jgi:hypothetical protein
VSFQYLGKSSVGPGAGVKARWRHRITTPLNPAAASCAHALAISLCALNVIRSDLGLSDTCHERHSHRGDRIDRDPPSQAETPAVL